MKNNLNQLVFKKISKSAQINIVGGQSNSWACAQITSYEEEKRYLPSGCQ